MYTCISVFANVYMYVCLCVCLTYACMFSCMCVCARVCIPTYVCMCIHVSIHMYVCTLQLSVSTCYCIQHPILIHGVHHTQVLFAWRMATTQGRPLMLSWVPTLQSGRESLLHTFQIWKFRTTLLTLQKVTN